MEFKKNAWKPIFMCFLLSIGGSYLIMSLFYSLLGKGGPLNEVLLAPSATYSFIMADPNLQKIMIVLPFILLAFLLKAFKNEILLKKYKDASEFGIHGTAKWLKPSEVIDDKTFSKKNGYKKNPIDSFKMEKGIIVGKVPGKRELLIMPRNTTIDNRNVLVIGSPGSGKGQAFVFPNMLNHTEETIIVTDPKGEIYNATHQIKRDQGYKVYQIDFVNFVNCERYNPLDYVFDDEDARSLAKNIASNSVEDGKRDFWSESAIAFLTAFILYVKTEYDDANMNHIVELVSKAGKENEFLDDVIDNLSKEHPSYHLFKLANLSSGNTRSGIMATLAQQISIFSMKKIANFTKTGNFNFYDLQKEKSVLYVKLRMDDNPFVQLTATFFDQLISVFYNIAEENGVGDPHGAKLPIPTIFLMDEFANIGTISKYPKVLATCRGLGMSMMTIIQDFGQLEDKKRYGAEMARSIISNHDTTLFLRTKDTKTAEYFMKLAGDTTAQHSQNSRSESTSLGKGGSKSTSEQYVKKPLITLGQLLTTERNTCYVFLSGLHPLELEKSWQYEIYVDLLKNYTKYREKLGYTTPLYQEDEYYLESHEVEPIEDIEEIIDEESFEDDKPIQETVEPIFKEIEEIAASIEEHQLNQTDDFWIEEELQQSIQEIENDLKEIEIEQEKVNQIEDIGEDDFMNIIAEMLDKNKTTQEATG